jgi:ribosome biogenesis GTPase A
MTFEEALKQLREGKKIRSPYFAKDEYLEACRVGLIFDDTPIDKKPISIVRVKDGRQHDSMAGKLNYVAKIKRELKKVLSEEDYKKYHRDIFTEIEISKIFDEDVFLYPQINLLLIMRDDWEVVE